MNLLVTSFKWMYHHARLTLELALVIALIIGGWVYNCKVNQLIKINAEKAGLEAGLRQQITIRDSKILTLTRQKDGSVVYKERYLPPEGYVIVKQKDQEILQREYVALIKELAIATDPAARLALEKKIAEKLLGMDNSVVVKNHGFTFKPGFGMGWANHGVKPRVDFKYYFWDRYGAIIGGSENGVGFGVSRHLDDVLWTHPQNLELYLQYNPFTFNSSDSRGEIGFRLNF